MMSIGYHHNKITTAIVSSGSQGLFNDASVIESVVDKCVNYAETPVEYN